MGLIIAPGESQKSSYPFEQVLSAVQLRIRATNGHGERRLRYTVLHLVFGEFPCWPVASTVGPGWSPAGAVRPRSTPSTDEQDFQESSPLMKHVFREVEERFGGWVDDDLSREAPFQKQVGTGRLRATRHDHETGQMVLLRI